MKVASYCRVSTDREDQANSFEAQQRYYREYVARQPGWELYGVYADEGISGTGTKKRAQFNRMIADAYAGKFRLIITKEVSRFSRNIVDTITYTRDLKAIGVGVLFVNDGISTLDPDAELRLSIMASIAQEESRRTSSRVVWGQTRQMERGVVFGRSMLGYDVVKGRLCVNPEGAEVVRLIFSKYALEQEGTAQIARFLTAGGYRTSQGNTCWRSGTVIKILKNEKYAGDLVQKKTYTLDYLTHEKKRNTGQVPLIRLENHHEPIVSRELWELAQARLHQNNKHTGESSGHSNRYAFSGRIRCGQCGSGFVGRSKNRSDGTRLRRWCCAGAIRSDCDVGRLVRDDDARNMLKTAIANLDMDRNAMAGEVTALVLQAVRAGERQTRDRPECLHRELERIRRKKELLLDRFLDGEISGDDMQAMNRKYDALLDDLRARIRSLEETGPDPWENENALRQELLALLNGDAESEVFFKHLLEQLTVFKDRHLELRLKHLPTVFRFR